MTSTVRMTGDPAEFKVIAFPFLQGDPVLNSMLISNVQGRIDGLMYDPAPPVFLSVHDDDRVVGVVICTALRGVLLGDLAEDLIPVVLPALAESVPDAKYIEGTTTVAEPFAARYADQLGRQLTDDRVTRLHRLADFVPQHADGSPRRATEDDVDDVARMIAGFGEDTSGRLGVEEEQRWARGRIGAGQLWLWENDGRTVCMAGQHGPVFGADRIGPVYTPPADRGHGYGSALTAYLTRRILDGGNQACLYTDLANPTSNKIYARIGYRPVTDFVRYRFS
ncbi:hypothetical protein BWI15_36710 [Kribbella sp. ALI-6-A]|uniref:GNAT family N-acetyltransferase n=1 Tax=Kribbella sp. ALI-6-A TaxID=1933817 RepID=UPI00097C6726|nr:GNAT family N-acetyltransferase [Kribbella sp. ALI-6-A]ONI68533.1 hypothetical protein BWI15_36710 [Kribbella sp. ALI-6-A]